MNHSAATHRLAEQLRAGEHHLYNGDLRSAYGLRRVTAKARRDVARELQELGIEILSNPANEPLVVRKAAEPRSRTVASAVRRWPRWTKWAAVICLFLLLAGVAGRSSKHSRDTGEAPASHQDRTATKPLPVEKSATPVPVKPAPESKSEAAPAPTASRRDRVTRVIDGDTVVLASLGRTRLIGVDTPEVYGGQECFGQSASKFTKSLLPAGTPVRYRFDAERRDRYGRALAYVFKGDKFVNGELAKRGYAVPLTIPPNVRYADKFASLSRKARNRSLGLWAASTCGGDADKPLTHQPSRPADKKPAESESHGGSRAGVDLSGDKDCPDFSSQQDAQDYFEAKGGPQSDPDRLDADRDGIACEALA